MKKLLLALALVLAPSLAFGQCAGVFPAHTVCGNTGASPNVPSAVTFGGTIIGPGTSVVGHFATWGDTAGSVLADFDLYGHNNIWTGTNTFNGTVSGTGFGTLFASPPAIGTTAPAAGKFTTLQATGNLTTNVTGSTQCLQANSSGVVAGTGGACPVKLTAATTFYYSTTGNNTTGDGSIGNPWADPLNTYKNIQKTYDTAGEQVTISPIPGECATYVISVQLFGSLSGQGPAAIFAGNGGGSGQPGAPAKCTVIQPPAGYSFSAVSGANISLQGMFFDQSIAMLVGASSDDTIVAGQGGQITIGPDITFGDNLNPNNDIIAANGGYVQVNGNSGMGGRDAYTITKTSVVTTATCSGSSNTLIVGSATGLHNYMGVGGSNIPVGMYISNISGTTVTISAVQGAPTNQTTGSCSGTYAFTTGGQDHLLVGGSGANVYYNTNGNPAFPLLITVNGGQPMYTAGFVHAYNLASINIQAVGSVNSAADNSFGGPVNAVPFIIGRLSNIDTNFEGVPYLPGQVGNVNVTAGSCSAASTALTVAANNGIQVGNQVTAYQSTTSTFSIGTNPITVTSATGIAVNNRVVADGIPPGDYVTNVSGTSITLQVAPYAAETGATVVFKDTADLNTYVTVASGTSITLKSPCVGALSTKPVAFFGLVQNSGEYD